jgi:hypothetical protein
MRWQWILAMMKKDWTERGKAFLTIWVVLFALLFVPDEQWKLGGMAVIIVTAAFFYPYYTFTTEVSRGTMSMLLGLPIPPIYILLGKFASLYSMCLITVNIPCALLFDAHLLYLYNAEMLFIATITLACSVVYEHPLAPLLPVGAILMAFQRQTAFKEFQPYEYKAATFALILTPMIAVGSTLMFRRQTRVR